MASEPLRVGILCNGLTFQRWQAECIRQVAAVPGVQLVVLVKHERPATQPLPLAQRVLRYPWSIALYMRYRRKRFAPPAMKEEDLTQELGTLPVVACSPKSEGHGQYFSPSELEAIKGHKPDVLLRFGFNIIRGEILQLPRFGVWSYHHGDEEKYRGGPPVFWEIMHSDPVTGAVLQRLTDKLDGGYILKKGWFKTIDHSLSETVDTVLMRSAGWAAQVCKNIIAGRPEAATGTLSETKAPIFKYPTNAAFLHFLKKQASNKVRFHQRELKEHEEWNLGVMYQPIQRLLDERPSMNARWLPDSNMGQFRADSFGYMRDGELNVLYEKYDYGTGKGEISRLRPKRDNVLKRSRTMLTTEGHLSYPFVVEHNGEHFVIPESAAAGRVDLYRIDQNNESLEHVTTLLQEPVFDPTVFFHNGLWWLFGTKAPLTSTELFAWYSNDLTGPFTPHLLTPIKTDVRSARPGGTPFLHEGMLYRPAQDCSQTYGGRVALCKVTELSPTSFSEELVKYIGPFKGTHHSHGLHTVSAVGDITLVDGKRYITDRRQLERVRKRKLGKLTGGLLAADTEVDEDADEEDEK